jgi:RHS repeat-associated protein
MKVPRSVRIVFLFLAAFLFQTDKFLAFAATVPPGACFYALDSSASRAFQIAGAQSVNTACGVVVESSASDGFEMEGAETLYLQNHAQVSVVGGAQLNGQTKLWDTISNKQVQAVKVSSPGDPLTSVAAPAAGAIVSKSHAYFDMNSKPTNNTLSPGVYCGGLTIGNTNGTAFTMSPGVYIMAGGGLVLNTQAMVKGTGVTVYNTSSAGWGCSGSYSYTPITISGQVTATLSAPTTGALSGILFFGNRSGCSAKESCVDQINGGSTTLLNGALYFASDEIEITGSNASGYMMLVADKIYINGISTLGNNGNPFDGITVSVLPSTATLLSGQTQQFTALVNNSSNTAVTWSISPAGTGSINSSGLYTAPSSVTAAQTVTVTATSQADDTKLGTATVKLTPPVVKTTPAITWATPAAMTYGTVLSGTQLDATTTVAGSFVYAPGAGTVLAAGSQTLTVTLTPTDTTDYNTAKASVTLTVNKATPTITWAAPAAISYGTVLNATQLDATASVPGSFAYTPAAGTVLTAGTQTLSVTFTPTDMSDYSNAIASVSLTVNNPTVSVTVTPPSATLYGGQTQQFTASVANSSNQTVVWTIIPAGVGTIDATGLYTAPATISTQQTVTVTATSLADSNKSASAAVTLSMAQCGSNGYSYQRAIVIDHTKVPNTDQTNFPFLFSTIDPLLATTASGGHVASSNGYDIIFTLDAAGQNKLDYEMEEYNSTTGQVIAWVRIPTLTHSTDTVIYVFYGNSGVTTSQQNSPGVWNGNYIGVWHLANGITQFPEDSTSNGNAGIVEGASATTGKIDGAAAFDGASAKIALNANGFPSGGTARTISAWFQASAFPNNYNDVFSYGTPSQDQAYGFTVHQNSLIFFGYSDDFNSNTAILPGQWYYAVGTFDGTNADLYINGVLDNTANKTSWNTTGSKAYIGEQINDASEYFDGVIDEVRISNSVQTPDWIASEYNNQGSPSKFYTLYSENVVEVIPASVNLYAGQRQQFMATNACGAGVTWSMPTSAQGTLTAGGLYTAPSRITAQQTIAITATSQGSGDYTGDGVVLLLPAPLSPTLTLAAAVQSPYVTGASQTFTATFRNYSGTPIAGEVVTFTAVGANNQTGSGTTDENGIATYAYTGTNSGTDTIQATASISEELVTSNNVSATWVVPVNAISTTSITGMFFPNNGPVYDFNTSPTAVPLFTQTFPSINFNPPFGAIPGNTTVGVGTRPFTDVVTDHNGNFAGTIPAQGNGWEPGVVPGNLGSFQAVFTGSFIVAQGGDTVISVYVDNSFILGIGGGAIRVSGSGDGVTGFYQYPVMGVLSTSIGETSITVRFPGPGTYPYELDYVECCGDGGGDTLSLMMTAGAPNGSSGTPPTASLVLSPNSVQPQPLGGQESFIALATDALGAPVSGLSVALVVSYVDAQELTAVTDSTGHATFTYKDLSRGTASVQAIAFIDGMVTYSNQVSVPWTLPATTTTTTGGNDTLSIGITANSTVALPNALTLTGTVTDSAGLTPTVAWSQVSGPGTVTFATPQQASTTASFSEAGRYVLELSASDTSGNSGSVQWQVTVNPVPGTDQGWVGSPAYGSTVSGVVPITLASGVTLQSGTLTYYPASNPGNVTVLNANTTGSGQIGTLDTTVLPNGTYWIQLQATDTNGNQQYALVLVTVAGNYKPGRVTATVTDLVVPATGLAINIQRTYDSLNASTSGDFGYGWNLGINTNLTVDPKGDVTFTLGGQRKTFYLAPQFGGWVFPYYFVAYTPEPGLHGTLTDSASGCVSGFDFVVSDSSMWECLGGGGQFNPPGYIYTDPNGTSYTISAAGNLQSIQDRSGNGLTITANGITSTTGLKVPFVRDASNRITKITDPQGNIYSYGYDSNGNLASVTYPNTTQPSTYTYDSNHLYLTGTDARSNPLPVTEYFDSADTDTNGNSLSGRLKSVTNTAGKTSYAYDLATNTTTVTYPDSGTATMVYDSYGDLLSSIDPLGNITTNVYDAKHNLISVTDPLGHTSTYTYDANGNKTSSSYPKTAASGNTTSTTAYNQYSEPTSTTDELGNVRAFNYDTNFNPQSVTDSAGTLASFIFNDNSTLASGAIGYDISTSPAMASQFTYDANGNMASRTDALGRTTTYTYNSLGQKTATVAPTPTTSVGSAASTTAYQYDALGNLIQTVAPLSRTSSSTYDANGNKTSDTDARGNTTSYQYDALNRLVTTTYPDKTTSTRTYDFRNNVVTETDQGGNVTLHAYDLAGRQTSVTRGYGSSNPSTTSYTYDAAGRKTSETDSLGHTTGYTYDEAGRLIAISGVKGNTSYTYDDAGNRISSTDGKNNTTKFKYNARKRLVETDYPDGTSVKNTYDGPGNLASVTDQAQNVVQYTYDAANQLKTVVQVNHPNPSNNTNLYGYNPLGNLIALTDENLHTTQNSFDMLGEPVQKTLPDQTHTESRVYDEAGNLTSLTHFNGVTTTYTYDSLNRLLSRATPGESTVSFTYTPTGKYLTSTAADGTVNYAYDALDRLITKATPEGTLSYTYDAAGHVESIVSFNTNGVSVSYSYDDLNRLSTVVDNRLSGQNTTTYTYDNASNVGTATYPNGLQSSFTYDSLNRLTSLVTPVSGYTYQLGPTGNRTQAVELNHNRVVNWSYDGINRLTGEAINSDEAKNSGSVSYSLDPVGNRSSAVSSLGTLSSGSWSYNADDEVSSETYDDNGNTLSTGGKSFTYDSENHLTSMTSGGTVVTIVYDAFGNRVAKTVNGVTTKYLVEDDVNPTGLPQVLEEVQNGAAVRTYTYGLQRISEYQVVNNAWTASFYGYDGAGSIRQLSDSTGKVTDEYEYDAYGNSFTKTGTTPNNYLYRGEQYDSDLGLYYLRARYYNATTGRFMSRDPLDGKALDPASLHKYLYSGGDPVNAWDPSGRDMVEFSLVLIRVIKVAAILATCTTAIVEYFDQEARILDQNSSTASLLRGLVLLEAKTTACLTGFVLGLATW